MSLALQGGFLATGPPGKPLLCFPFKAVWSRGSTLRPLEPCEVSWSLSWRWPPGGAGAAGIVASCEVDLPYRVSPPGLCQCCAHPQGHFCPPMVHSDISQLTSSFQKVLLIPPGWSRIPFEPPTLYHSPDHPVTLSLKLLHDPWKDRTEVSRVT